MNAISARTIILREPARFWAELREEKGLKVKAIALTAVTVVSLAVYGAILGSSHSLVQSISSAIKLPILYLATMAICFPTLHVLNLLFGSRQSLMQLLVLLLSTLAVTATLMLAFAPISAFFIMSTSNYDFIKLLNVSILATSALLGVRFFYRGMRELSTDAADRQTNERILRLWILLYAFVGSQLAWTLRPFFGSSGEPFEWVRQIGGNFYADVIRAASNLLGG